MQLTPTHAKNACSSTDLYTFSLKSLLDFQSRSRSECTRINALEKDMGILKADIANLTRLSQDLPPAQSQEEFETQDHESSIATSPLASTPDKPKNVPTHQSHPHRHHPLSTQQHQEPHHHQQLPKFQMAPFPKLSNSFPNTESYRAWTDIIRLVDPDFVSFAVASLRCKKFRDENKIAHVFVQGQVGSRKRPVNTTRYTAGIPERFMGEFLEYMKEMYGNGSGAIAEAGKSGNNVDDDGDTDDDHDHDIDWLRTGKSRLHSTPVRPRRGLVSVVEEQHERVSEKGMEECVREEVAIVRYNKLSLFREFSV
ncbi:UNVERIFIED_CONTAM: hypothetical protein HDU68_004126 [Siphonaria sp. JEL0065]|nr:hypothetical protein HDU68_004126 [Siphonaria sp. JEL0065]